MRADAVARSFITADTQAGIMSSAFSNTVGALNVFRYITSRTGGAISTNMVFVFLFDLRMIAKPAAEAGQGTADLA